MNDQDTQVSKVFRFCFFHQKAQNVQGGAAASYPPSFRIGNDVEMGASRQEAGDLSLFQLLPEAFCLVFIRGSEDNVIPAGKGFAGQGAEVVVPGVLEVLGKEEGFQSWVGVGCFGHGFLLCMFFHESYWGS